MSDSVHSIEDFLQVVRKSGLVDDAALQQAVAAWPDRSAALPEDLVQSLIDSELLTKWQTDQLRKGRHKGFMLGKYRLLRLLGAGGMSSVYLAEHTTLHGKAAIKVLPVKRVDQTSYLARFEREARAAYRLSHPHIVRTIDLETAGTIHFLAMEYIDGTDLHAKVKQDGPLPIRDAVDYLRQAALGLQFAHDEGFVHRDIKPANLMLDRRGVVKILDLGLALGGEDEEDSLTKEHGEKVLGTADYLAPEQAQDSHKADRRSDIYALGCTLHYLLTGRPPFPKGTLAERIQAHMRTPPPNLLEERADVPPAIAELYFRMMEKHPDARPQSAKEISDALAAWLATSDAKDGGRPTPPRRAPPRRTPSAAASPTGSSNIHTPPVGIASPSRGGRSGSGVGSGSGSGSHAGSDSGPAVGSGVGSGSGVGADAFDFTAPARRAGPSSGSRPSASLSKPHADTGHAHDPSHAGPKRKKRTSWMEMAFLGVPLPLWILLAAGLVVAGVLAWLVLNPAPKKRKPSQDQSDQAQAADTDTGADGAVDAEPAAAASGPVDPKPKSTPAAKQPATAKPAAPPASPVEGGLDFINQAAPKPEEPPAGEAAAAEKPSAQKPPAANAEPKPDSSKPDSAKPDEPKTKTK